MEDSFRINAKDKVERLEQDVLDFTEEPKAANLPTDSTYSLAYKNDIRETDD